MTGIYVAVINASTVLHDDQVAAVVPALQHQVDRDFFPIWGIRAELAFVLRGRSPTAGAWWLSILDNSHQAGMAGYHELTREGLPLGKVYAETVSKAGMNWTVTASHEMLEMLADPFINLSVFVERTEHAGRIYSYEVCDACEAEEYAYAIDGVQVSDFVYPAWFDPHHAGGKQLDYGGHIRKPFELLPGGYISVYDVRSGTGWQDMSNGEALCEPGQRRQVGSRRERRGIPVDQWRRSDVAFE